MFSSFDRPLSLLALSVALALSLIAMGVSGGNLEAEPASTGASTLPSAMDLADYSRDAEFDVIIHRDVMVPMRDGVRLATDIYFPAKNGARMEGRFPAILERTCYDKIPRAPGANNPDYFAKRGYVFVFQDSRGHGNSEGEFYIHVPEGPDGYDTVEWIAQQPWSNGDVGTVGYSYDAATQNSLAREAPPHLKAMFLGWSHADYKKEMQGLGGANYLSHNLSYTIGHALRDRMARSDLAVRQRLEDRRDNIWELFAQPLSKHLQIFKGVPMARQWYEDWLEHQDYDDYWRQNGYNFIDFHDRYPDVPIFLLGSWYDPQFTLNHFAGLTKPPRESPTLLMYGPWEHGPVRASKTHQANGTVDFGTESALDWTPLRLRFFDETLKGMKTGLFDQAPIQMFVMGGGGGRKNSAGRLDAGGRWRIERTYPLPKTELTEYYLHGDGTLSPAVSDGGTSSTTYSFDPNHPVPMIGGRWTHPRSNGGPQNQVCSDAIPACKHAGAEPIPLSQRSDVLVFATPPLEQDVEIVGPVTVRFWASSTAVDTDFTAKLVDVYPANQDYPQGYDMILLDNVIRARYRNSLARQELMEPGQLYEFTIDLWATANLFKKGHRIRLDISSSNWPEFDVNPNTGEKVGYHTSTIVAENTIYHDQEHPSHVLLPIIP